MTATAEGQGLDAFLERVGEDADQVDVRERAQRRFQASSEPEDTGLAKLEDIRIRRDDQGRVVPLEVDLPGLELTVLMLPFNFGFWRTELDQANTVQELDWDQKAAMIQECIVPADCPWSEVYPRGLTVDVLERDFDPQTVDELVWICWEYSNARRREGYQEGKAEIPATATSPLNWMWRLLKRGFTSGDTATQDPETSTN